jgi:hypothetical protein
VYSFAGNVSNQAIPVSRFGDTSHTKIWLILTNPKGDRNYPNVGHQVNSYGVSNRSVLTKTNIQEIFKRFSLYFNQPNAHR